MKDPRLATLLENSPDNFLSRLVAAEEKIEGLLLAESPTLEEINSGRMSVVDLLISPARGIVVTDPTSTDYTGAFMAGNGLLFGSDYFVMGNVINGVIKTGFTDVGTLYATDAEIEGTIIIGTGSSAGGWLINSTQIFSGSITLDSSIPAILVGAATAIMTGDGVFIGDVGGTYEMRIGDPAGDYLLWNGSSLSVVGLSIGTGSTAGGWQINSTSIFSGSISLDSSIPAIKIGAATAIMTGAGVFLGNDSSVYKMRIGDPAGNYLLWDGSILTANGQWIKSAGMDPALQKWETNIIFSSASDVQVNWTSGTLILSDGNTYAISAGNTGTMAALTYVYLDIAVSATVLQISTTYTTATGDGKILVAAAQNATAGASVLPFAGQQPIINGGAQITALSILAGNIAAGAITATKISVSSLSAITATMGSLTIDSTLTMNGASGAIAVGTTPPSSAVAGTGLWIDRTGVYALTANVQQATLTAAGLTAGAGGVTISEDGIIILSDGSPLFTFKTADGLTDIATVFHDGAGNLQFDMVDVTKSFTFNDGNVISGHGTGVDSGFYLHENFVAKAKMWWDASQKNLVLTNNISGAAFGDGAIVLAIKGAATDSWLFYDDTAAVSRFRMRNNGSFMMRDTSTVPAYEDGYANFFFTSGGDYKVRMKIGSTEKEVTLATLQTTTTIQMSADTYLDQFTPTTNFTALASFYIGEAASAVQICRVWIKPDFSSIPAGVTFISAILKLTPTYDDSGNARTMRAHRCLRAVVANETTYNKFSTAGGNWGTAGAANSSTDYDGAIELGNMTQPATPTLNVALPMTFSANGVAELQKMFDGTYTNNGIILFVDTQNADQIGYASRENATAAYRPVIELTYV